MILFHFLNFRPNMDDTIAILNAQNKSSGVNEPVEQQVPDDTVNISILSRDESTVDEVFNDERPVCIHVTCSNCVQMRVLNLPP